jgi:thiol-disulfide isomerase/thioredoxin
MKTIFSILFIFSVFTVQAQTDSLPYQRFPDVPPFQLLGTDSSTIITKDNLKPGQPVLIMFFSPDCDHCQKQMELILKDIDSLKNVQIVLASFQPFEQIKEFSKKYNLADHQNIYIGRDTKYIMPPFYGIHKLPFLALYNSNGKLITTYQAGATGETLVNKFRSSL